MIDLGKQNVLGVRIDAVDYEAALERIIGAARDHHPLSVAALAVHGVMTGVTDDTHRHRLNHIDLAVPDGQPVRFAVRLIHRHRLPDRVYGPTLMERVVARAATERLRIFLYGSTAAVLESLRRNLIARHPGLIVAGFRASRFRRLTEEENEEALDEIRSSGAAVTFVGLGCPRQEVWAFENTKPLSMPVLAVGAAFDFHAGTLSQAPPRLQKAGLEWLYRLTREPRRLWRRYVILNPWYLTLLAAQWLGLREFPVTNTREPREPLRYG